MSLSRTQGLRNEGKTQSYRAWSIKLLAEEEIARPTDALTQMSIGDGWWDFAEKQQGSTKASVRGHALEWYQRAWVQVSGDIKEKLRERFKTGLSRPRNPSPKPITSTVAKPGNWGLSGNLTATYAHSGLYSLYISKPTNPDDNTPRGAATAKLPARAGEQFVLSGWIMTENTVMTDVFGLQFFDDRGRLFQPLNGPGVPADQPYWTFRSRIVTCPAGATSCAISIFTWGKGASIWIDDVSLKRVGQDTELLSNPGFENTK